MRITGGNARGITLTLPRGGDLRPATDSLRQAVFSSLAARVPGARFLDLFAGSGAYGLEALSRGASGGVFVERDPRAVACIRRNLEAVCKSLRRDADGVEVLQGDAVAGSHGHGAEPEIVFIDPPYELIGGIADALFERLTKLAAANADITVVFEMPGGIELSPAGWTCLKRLGKGARQPTACIFKPVRSPTSEA